ILLNTIKLPPQLAELRQLELSQLLIRAHMYRDRTPEDVAAEVPAPVWRFTNSDVKLELNQGDMKFSVHADLNADEVRTPIFAKIAHKHMADTLSIEVGIDNPKPEVLNPLLPQAIRDMIQAPVSVAVYANLDAENKLQSPRFDLSFAAGQLHLPQVYQQPVPFEQARIEGWYDV